MVLDLGASTSRVDIMVVAYLKDSEDFLNCIHLQGELCHECLTLKWSGHPCHLLIKSDDSFSRKSNCPCFVDCCKLTNPTWALAQLLTWSSPTQFNSLIPFSLPNNASFNTCFFRKGGKQRINTMTFGCAMELKNGFHAILMSVVMKESSYPHENSVIPPVQCPWTLGIHGS